MVPVQYHDIASSYVLHKCNNCANGVLHQHCITGACCAAAHPMTPESPLSNHSAIHTYTLHWLLGLTAQRCVRITTTEWCEYLRGGLLYGEGRQQLRGEWNWLGFRHRLVTHHWCCYPSTPAVLGQYPALLPIVVLPLPQYPSSTQPCFQSNSGATPVPLPPWSPSFNCTSNATVAALQNPSNTVLHKTPQTIIFGGQFAL